MPSLSKPLYRHDGVALLRAAARALSHIPVVWPDPADPKRAARGCTGMVPARLTDAIRQASPSH